MSDSVTDSRELSQTQLLVAEALEGYRDFVIRNAYSHILDPEEKDRELQRVAREITQLFMD